MIELRWIDRPLYQIGDVVPEGVNVSNPIVRVLQFRTFDQEYVFYPGPSGDPLTGWDRRWSEWQDVPVVKL